MIQQHPAWADVRQFLRVEAYDRDTNWQGDIRHRIEVTPLPNAGVRTWLLSLQTPCVRCGDPIFPVRERGTWGTLYLTVACPPDVKPGCSKGKEAADAYKALIAELQGMPAPPPEPSLLDLL